MSGDYEDDKWYYFWVTKNSQGMPCNPYYEDFLLAQAAFIAAL